ncbi:taste receptor type 2 member 40-like [Leptodactylus fuscus]|uniref:taste receptor type 2 member 40-like n=1 Tax=Leptodactylus fuscus TaxID=238119 RepID=UPI003F4E9124
MSALEISRVVVGITMGFTGMCLNTMIVLVNLWDWLMGIHVSSCDFVLSLIGLVNIFFNFDLVLDTIFRGFQTYITLSGEILLRILGLLIYLASCNFWFTVCLCTYYCLRIVSFTNGLLFLLKMRISMYLPKLLVISALESFFIAVPSIWNIQLENSHQSLPNISSPYQVISIKFPYKVTLMSGTIAPLILTLIPTVFTLNSLWRHTVMMKKKVLGSSSAQTQAHVTAARTMVLLLALHVFLYMASITVIWHSFNVDDISQYFSWFLVFSCPTLQALVLINGNTKLRKSAKHITEQIRTRYQMFWGERTGSHLQD